MNDKEIILELLEAIDGTLPDEDIEYYEDGVRVKCYKIFPYNPSYKFLNNTVEGVLSNIFKILEKERVLKVTFYPAPREAIDEVNKNIEDEIHKISGDLYYNMTSYRFIKLENFYPYLRSLRNEMSGKSDKYLIKKGELSFEEKSITKTNFGAIKQKYLKYLEACSKSELTIIKYTGEVNKFLNYFQENNKDFIDLDLDYLNSYLIKTRRERNLSVNSYSRIVIIIRSFLRYLYENEIIKVDFLNKITIPKTVTKEMDYLSDSDIKKVEYYLSSRKENYRGENLRDRLVFCLGLYCGLRKSEIRNLDWNNVNFDEDILKILNSKGGKDRKVKFGDKVKNILAEYRKISDKYIGAVVRGNFGKRISQCSLQKIIARIYRQSGIYRKGLTLHSLRHTYAVKQVEKGTDMHTIKNLLGHSSLATTDKYLHLLDKNIDDSALE